MKEFDVCLTFDLPRAREILEQSGLSTFTWSKEQRPSASELEELTCRGRALLCLLTDQINAEVLKRERQLEVIAVNAVGFNNIDLELCQKLSISVCNTPDVLADATADLALGLLIDRARRISEAGSFLRAGLWKGWDPEGFIGTSLKGKTLGIVGMGRIGSALAKRAHYGFDMKILYTAKGEKELPHPANFCQLDELFKNSDFISLHCPLTEATRGLIGAREFALMKEHAILINTARGPIVDEIALITALKNKTIAGAALDVFASEPLSMASELLNFPNVSLTPHIASADLETRLAMQELSAQNILDIFAGKRAKGEVHRALD